MVGTDAGIAGVALADWGLEALTVLMWNVPLGQLATSVRQWNSLHWGRPDDSTVTDAERPRRMSAPCIRACGYIKC